jgi:hypothetical protein
MTVYRYARANGQILPSRFVTSIAEATAQTFSVTQAYDLTVDFVSGSDVLQNSFVTGRTGYTERESLIGWWVFDKNITAAGAVTEDSSKKFISKNFVSGNVVSYPEGRPTLATRTPSTFIQTGSNYWDGTQDWGLIVTGSHLNYPFSFGDGGTDAPFTIGMWIRWDFLDLTRYILSKGFHVDDFVESEYSIVAKATGEIEFRLCSNGSLSKDVLISTSADTVKVDEWYHVVCTYDGRGGEYANLGMNIYVGGKLATIATSTSESTYVAMQHSKRPIILGLLRPSYYDFHGYIAELAIWNKELDAEQIGNLYGASIAGAYRLVRNFSQISPDNDTRTLGISSPGGRGFNVTDLPPDVSDAYLQGVNVITLQQLTDYTSFKIRPNSSFINTIDGKDVSRVYFNDAIAPTTFSSGSGPTVAGSSQVSVGGVGQLSKRLTHEREQRDLGQLTVYDNSDPFWDTADLDPVAIASKHPQALILPNQLVVQTSDELLDGTIEPLALRETIDGSGIEGPFYAHTFRASLGGMTDAFRRSYVIEDGWNLVYPQKGSAPFLDSTETMGPSPYGVDMPGAFSDNFARITPFVDYMNSRDKLYSTGSITDPLSSAEISMKKVLIDSASFDDNDMQTFDKMAPAGFIFQNDPVGIDSIAFGGLKK